MSPTEQPQRAAAPRLLLVAAQERLARLFAPWSAGTELEVVRVTTPAAAYALLETEGFDRIFFQGHLAGLSGELLARAFKSRAQEGCRLVVLAPAADFTPGLSRLVHALLDTSLPPAAQADRLAELLEVSPPAAALDALDPFQAELLAAAAKLGVAACPPPPLAAKRAPRPSRTPEPAGRPAQDEVPPPPVEPVGAVPAKLAPGAALAPAVAPVEPEAADLVALPAAEPDQATPAPVFEVASATGTLRFAPLATAPEPAPALSSPPQRGVRLPATPARRAAYCAAGLLLCAVAGIGLRPAPRPEPGAPPVAAARPQPAWSPARPIPFLAGAVPDPDYSLTHPGWQRLVRDSYEFRVYREGKQLKALQAIDHGEGAALSGWLEELTAGRTGQVTSSAVNGIHTLQKTTFPGLGELTAYRVTSSGRLAAFVLVLEPAAP